VFASDTNVKALWDVAASILCATAEHEKKTAKAVASALVNLVSESSIKALPPTVPVQYVKGGGVEEGEGEGKVSGFASDV
jgi:outer membrane protein W